MITIRGGVLSLRAYRDELAVDVNVRSSQDAFARLVGGGMSLEDFSQRDDVAIEGDTEMLERFISCLDIFEFGFEIVLP